VASAWQRKELIANANSETTMQAYSSRLILVAIMCTLLGVSLDRWMSPASAQYTGPCGVPPSAVPCELRGYKLFAKRDVTGLMLLQIQTNQGTRSFVATRSTMERFARELLDSIQRGGSQEL
jgi:hypothetical protein